MPFRLNANRRYRIPRQKHNVMNWRALVKLRQRGGLTAWFTDEAIEGWRAKPRTSLGERFCRDRIR